MSSESWLVGWVININDQEIKVLRRNRKHRLSRNKTHPNVVIGDWIAFRKNTVSGQGCLIQIIDPILPTKTLWISPKIGWRSTETQCICVKTTAIGSPNVQLQEGDSEIHRIWSPHFEYLADPLHLFDDPVNVKPNVAYDVWCRLNSDPKSQYDGESPILEIHSIEAPSESQMISLNPPWVQGSVSSPIDQASTINQSDRNQQLTAQNRGRSAETRHQSRGRQKICKGEQLQSRPSGRRSASIPISQASSLDQPSRNQQSTAQSQEPSAQTQHRPTQGQNMCVAEQLPSSVGHLTSSNNALTPAVNQQAHTEINEGTADDLKEFHERTAMKLQPLVTAPKMKTDSVDSTKQLAEIQGETECTAGTSIDLITQLLCERLKMVQSHRKECQAAIEFLNKSSMIAVMRCHRIQQMDARERHAKIVSEFAANRQKGCCKSHYTYEETSRILGMLRRELRSYLAFYLSCIYDCNENGIKGEEEHVMKELQMNDREFDENVVLSKETLSILDLYSPDRIVTKNQVPPVTGVQSSKSTHNMKFKTESPELNDKQPSVMVQKPSVVNLGSTTQDKNNNISNEANNEMDSMKLTQSDSANIKQQKTAIAFIVKQLEETRDLYQKHRQEANAIKLLSAKQLLSTQQWAIEGNHRKKQASALKVFLESNPYAEDSIPNNHAVSKESITKILKQLQQYARAQIRFHQDCAMQMTPKDAFCKNVLDTAMKWLEMDREQFEDNVLASPLAMRIIRRTFASGNTTNPNKPMESSSGTTSNQVQGIENNLRQKIPRQFPNPFYTSFVSAPQPLQYQFGSQFHTYRPAIPQPFLYQFHNPFWDNYGTNFLAVPQSFPHQFRN